MKIRSSILAAAVLSLFPLAVSGQAPATAAATPAKKVLLSSGDKQLVKNAGETQLVLLHMSEIFSGETPPGSQTVQKLGAATKKAMNESWGDLGVLVMRGGGEMPPTAQTTAEKKDLAELRKQPADKFDKAYLKAYQKELKRATTAFASGAKSAQDADLKAAFAKYQPILAKLETDATAAEAETKKK